MKPFRAFLSEAKLPKKFKWASNPNISWWLDKPYTLFYHGTHISNLDGILKEGIFAPTSGPTAGFVSLALEPNTSHAYASMSGLGGESQFRAAGAKVKNTPHNERVVLVLKIPQKYFLSKMAPARGNMDAQRNKLTDKSLYEKAKKSGMTDQEYYQITEIRIPKHVDSKYIIGYMQKS